MIPCFSVSRGLGFSPVQFKNILATPKGYTVFAACRKPDDARQLAWLAGSNLFTVNLDVANTSMKSVAEVEGCRVNLDSDRSEIGLLVQGNIPSELID